MLNKVLLIAIVGMLCLPAATNAETITVSGDILTHAEINRAAKKKNTYDYQPLFTGIQPLLARSDINICHLETSIYPYAGISDIGWFNAPPQLATGLAQAGFDACSTASNHSLDFGVVGAKRTAYQLRKNKIISTGSGTTRPRIIHGTVKVGLLSYSDHTNLPASRRARQFFNLIPAKRVLPAVRKINRQATKLKERGADIVILSLHWGAQKSNRITRRQHRLAKLITRTRVDLINGHGSHAVQKIKRINNKFVLFSSGDLLSANTRWRRLQSGLARGYLGEIQVINKQIKKVIYHPTVINHAQKVSLAAVGSPAYRKTVREIGRTSYYLPASGGSEK